jgi:hypothetical protein
LPSYVLRISRRIVAVRGALALAALVPIGCTVVAAEPPIPGPGLDGSVDGAGGSSSGGGFAMYDASACQPGSVATYQPASYRGASPVGQGACVTDASGSDPIQGFYDACLGAGATTDACNDFRQQNATCVACILTPQTAAHYGPLIDFTTYVIANVAGCIEVAPRATGALDPDAFACAKSVQALAGCELAACGANCPVHDATSLASYQSCATASEQSGCDPWATAAACAEDEQDAGGLAAACLGSFQVFYDAVVPYFCGPAPSAGGDAGAEAAVEAGGETPDAASE